MGTTGLLVFALVTTLVMIAGITWLLWEDATRHRRSYADLRTCEEIWSHTP
jgi:hypothetical protein